MYAMQTIGKNIIVVDLNQDVGKLPIIFTQNSDTKGYIAALSKVKKKCNDFEIALILDYKSSEAIRDILVENCDDGPF